MYGYAMALISLGCKDRSNTSENGGTTGSEQSIHTKKTQSARTGIFSPENELAGFQVPEGFVVELVASERDGVINPIHMAFDDAGRLWTQTAEMYPLDPVTDIQWQDLLKLMDD